MATFGVLGPVAVDDGCGPVAVAAAKQRAVLAALALRPNQVVGTEALTEVLWPAAKPANAKQAVLNYIARLRRTLGAAGERVQTGAGGYRLVIHADAELDYRHAAAMADAACAACEAGDWYEGQHLAETALGLWRGEPLEDVPNDRLRCEWLGVFEALRLRLEEARVDAMLEGGRYERAAAGLAAPIAAWPLHEPFYERRLLAYYGAGRRADALSIYRTLRITLRDSLGADPAERMRTLHELVLRDAPVGELMRTWRGSHNPDTVSVAGTAGETSETAATPETPRTAGPGEKTRAAQTAETPQPPPPTTLPSQLPRRPHLLIGRDSELGDLTRILADPAIPAASPGAATATATDNRIAALTGPAGVGKTSLALAWAHTVADRFPDGRFYLDLNGFAADAAPMDGDDAVTILLDFLSVPAHDRPATPEGRLARYRAATAGKRLLMVFDNARDAAQVRPLLPAGDACRALVTSRRSLDGLVALDGAEHITLAPLAAEDSRSLLSRRLGANRTSGQEAAVEAIAEHCAHLPLALSVAAARAAIMTATPLTALADQLHAGVLDTLSAGDAASSVRNVLSWSYLRLPDEAARVFRFLGLHPGPEITPAAAAALADVPLVAAAPLLGELAATNLLTEPEPGRYAMHSLLRAFAVEQFAAVAPPEARRPALHRLYDYYLRWAIEAEHSFVTMPTAVRADGVPLPPGLEPRPFGADNSGPAWFDTERTVLMALVAHAAADGLDDYACRLAAAHSCGLMVRKRYHDAARQGRIALAAAKSLGDLRHQGGAYFQIGRALSYSGEAETARFQLERALRIQRSLGDDTGLVETHRALANAHRDLGEVNRWRQHTMRYLAAASRIGAERSVCEAQHQVGWCLFHQGRLEEAIERAGSAAATARRLGMRRQEAWILDSLGTFHTARGAREAAYEHFMLAVDVFDELGLTDQSERLLALADAHAVAGRLDRARQIWDQVAEQSRGLHPYAMKRLDTRRAGRLWAG